MLIFLVLVNLRKSLLEQFNTSEPEKPIKKSLAKYSERIYSIFLHSRFVSYPMHIETLLNSMVGKVPISISPLFALQTTSIATRFHEIESTPFSDY